MKIHTPLKFFALLFVTSFVVLIAGCEKKYFPKPPAPKTAVQTTNLEAGFVSTPPLTTADAFWKTADYIRVPMSNLNTGMLYPAGYLNMTGTYQGLSSFNNGADPKLLMKAAYDENKLYIYLEWTDNKLDAAYMSSIINGPGDPLKTQAADSAGGWTSQGNSDKVSLAFEINSASSQAGSFSDMGCAASCHQNKMQPQTGTVDIWTWDVATSDALGYTTDMVCDGIKGLVKDSGQSMVAVNKINASNPRSIPAFEWNGTDQSYTRPDGKTVLLDAGYYLLKSNATAYTGDYAKGEKVYRNSVYGCGHCHGDDGGGEGPNGSATAFASVGFARKYSRSSLISFASSSEHEGNSYWAQVPAASVNDLIAYIKGMASIPGVVLTPPGGSGADIWSVSNVVRARINATPHTLYSVILVRNLSTGNPDDVQFTAPAGKSFPFGVALMNGDSKNHIGSNKQILTFKQK